MIWILAIRNATRNMRRSALTLTTVALGCTLLIVGLSWINGLFGSIIDKQIQQYGHLSIRTQHYAKLQHNLPIAEHLMKVKEASEVLKSLDGISDVYPVIRFPATLEMKGQIGDVFALVTGAPIDYHRDQLKLDQRIVGGNFFTEDSFENGCLIGIELAKEMKIKVGEKAYFTGQDAFGGLSAQKATILGIVDTGNGIFDRQLYISLQKSQDFADIPEGAAELLVFGDDSKIEDTIKQSGINLQKLTDSIDENDQPIPLNMTSWDTRHPFSGTLRVMRFLLWALGGIVVFVTALGILNTMMMSVLERTHEIGVLRAIGMSRTRVATMILLESAFIAVSGGVIGATIGGIVASLMASMGIDLGSAAAALPESIPLNTIIRPRYEFFMSWIALALSGLMAIFGALVPMALALRKKPVEAMNSKSI